MRIFGSESKFAFIDGLKQNYSRKIEIESNEYFGFKPQ